MAWWKNVSYRNTYPSFHSSCTLKMFNFPFDTQLCSFDFGYVLESVDSVNITTSTDPIDIDSFYASHEFDVYAAGVEIHKNKVNGDGFYVGFFCYPIMGFIFHFYCVYTPVSGKSSWYCEMSVDEVTEIYGESVSLSVCMFVYPSVYMCVYLPICIPLN